MFFFSLFPLPWRRRCPTLVGPGVAAASPQSARSQQRTGASLLGGGASPGRSGAVWCPPSRREVTCSRRAGTPSFMWSVKEVDRTMCGVDEPELMAGRLWGMV